MPSPLIVNLLTLIHRTRTPTRTSSSKCHNARYTRLSSIALGNSRKSRAKALQSLIVSLIYALELSPLINTAASPIIPSIPSTAVYTTLALENPTTCPDQHHPSRPQPLHLLPLTRVESPTSTTQMSETTSTTSDTQ